MANCPKCGRTTTVWNRDILSGFCSRCLIQAPTVRLGCGSLFLIFMIFVITTSMSNSNKKGGNSNHATRNQVEQLRKEVESIEIKIRKLQSTVDKLPEALTPPAAVSRDPGDTPDTTPNPDPDANKLTPPKLK